MKENPQVKEFLVPALSPDLVPLLSINQGNANIALIGLPEFQDYTLMQFQYGCN